jgi:DNA topoisomerase-1
LKAADLDLDTALRLLALPREVGRHPETGAAIFAGIGRFGSYIKHGSTFKSLAPDDDVLTIGLNRAVVLLAEPAAERRRRAPQPLRELGPHPDGGTVALYQGRYGPYVRHDRAFASLPKSADPATLSLDEALRLLAERLGKRRARPRNNPKPGAAKGDRAPTGKAASAAGRPAPPTGAARLAPGSKRAAGAERQVAAARPGKRPRAPRRSSRPG